ncbi:MAG: class I SAM-dependent methyltransferase [Alkalispirochaeta sp.]
MNGFLQRASAVAFDAVMAPLESLRLRRIRSRLLAHAGGAVLEVGAGTGVNIPFYDPDRVSSLTMSDLDDRGLVLTERVARERPALSNRVSVARIDAQRLPFPDNTFDTVVATLVFCSVECQPCGFDEIARVLKPDGRYLFLEHVRPDHATLAAVFDTVNPVWNRLSRGCNLNRDTLAVLRQAGFEIGWKSSDRNGVFIWGGAVHTRS